jgi:hypothetical protein
MNNVLEKPQSLSLNIDIQSHSNDDRETSLDGSWMKDMEAHEEQAADKILEFLIQSGARPNINATGDIIDIVTSITNSLNQIVPPHLSDQLKVMTDYIARWLCDYIEQTNISSLNIAFGFDAKITQEGEA